MATEQYLKYLFPDYPNEAFISFEVSFDVTPASLNSDLVYAMLDTIPEAFLSVDQHHIKIKIYEEKKLIAHLSEIIDILTIVKAWDILLIEYNAKPIPISEFRYFYEHLLQRNGTKNPFFEKSESEIRSQYLSISKRSNTMNDLQITIEPLSNNNIMNLLNIAISHYIGMYGYTMAVESLLLSQYEQIVVVEDSLVVDFRLEPMPWRLAESPDYKVKPWDYPCIIIQELTANTIFKFNYTKYRQSFWFDQVEMDFYKFHGVGYYNPRIDHTDMIDEEIPKLNLKKRLEAYSGETYHFVIIIMEDLSGKPVFGIGYTKGAVHTYILKLCKELEDKNPYALEHYGVSCLPYSENKDFISAFLSRKRERKRWRLENKFAYYYEDRVIRNEATIISVLQDILNSAKRTEYHGEIGYYTKPLNRWKSEELVYKIAKKLYRDYQVIYQYRPYFLKTENGIMSLDIYICGIKVAIEYQGKQHFEPVEYFGGKENFERQHQRDLLKAKRCKNNGVHLVYVYYWESITPDLIKKKVEEALNNNDK